MKPKILIARAVFPELIEAMQPYFEIESNQQDYIFTHAELAEKLRHKDGVMTTSSEIISADLFHKCTRLKVVCNQAVGYNNIDVAAASAAGVMVTNTPDVLTETTADFGWALLLATARRVTEAERWLRAGHWKQWRYDSFLGADMHSSTLGIIGMGRIGQAIARRSLGFDMRVLYHNRAPLSAQQEAQANNACYVTKKELLQTADHIILALPYSAQTYHTIGAAELDLMKPNATLINLARGGIVDDKALITALHERKIAAAGLDVFEAEPAFNPDFLALPNVVLTPHIASASAPTRWAMAECAAKNLRSALLSSDATPPPNLVNPEVFNRLRTRSPEGNVGI